MEFKTLIKNSYVPYSGTAKVCVVRSTEGQYFPGVRVENISYPLSISRIQSALFSCLASGSRPEAIIFPDEPGREELSTYWKQEYDISFEINPELNFDTPDILIKEKLDDKAIFNRLSLLCELAVTPNSDFQVSALLEVEGGFVPGVNVECSNWELGLCAERVAISRAVSIGHRSFGNMYVMAPKSDYVSPCGACRQVLMEHLPASRIVLHQNDNQTMSVTTLQLLPYHFGGEVLKKN